MNGAHTQLERLQRQQTTSCALLSAFALRRQLRMEESTMRASSVMKQRIHRPRPNLHGVHKEAFRTHTARSKVPLTYASLTGIKRGFAYTIS